MQATADHPDTFPREIQELAAQIGLRINELAGLRRILSRHEDVQTAILYGSRAKNTFRPGADIDLTLVGTDISLQERNRIAEEIDELDMPYELDLSLHSHIENDALLDHIRRVGITLYEQ